MCNIAITRPVSIVAMEPYHGGCSTKEPRARHSNSTHDFVCTPPPSTGTWDRNVADLYEEAENYKGDGQQKNRNGWQSDPECTQWLEAKADATAESKDWLGDAYDGASTDTLCQSALAAALLSSETLARGSKQRIARYVCSCAKENFSPDIVALAQELIGDAAQLQADGTTTSRKSSKRNTRARLHRHQPYHTKRAHAASMAMAKTPPFLPLTPTKSSSRGKCASNAAQAFDIDVAEICALDLLELPDTLPTSHEMLSWQCDDDADSMFDSSDESFDDPLFDADLPSPLFSKASTGLKIYRPSSDADSMFDSDSGSSSSDESFGDSLRDADLSSSCWPPDEGFGSSPPQTAEQAHHCFAGALDFKGAPLRLLERMLTTTPATPTKLLECMFTTTTTATTASSDWCGQGDAMDALPSLPSPPPSLLVF